MAKYNMPVEPFQEMIERSLQECAVEGLEPTDREGYVNLRLMTPLEQITEKVAENLSISYEAAARRLYEIRYGKTKQVSFRIADAIACSIGSGVLFWITDERVAGRYEEIGA